MRNLLTAILSAMVFFLPISSANAAEEVTPKLFLNGEIVMGSTPVIVDGTTLVPFRAIAELTGALVTWNEETSTATASLNSKSVQLTIDETVAYVNRSPVALPVAATVIDGRTFVPLRFVAETFGLKVDWSEKHQFIMLESPDHPEATEAVLWSLTLIGTTYWEGYETQLAREMGKQYVDKKTGVLMWLVSLHPPVGTVGDVQLVLRTEAGGTVHRRFSEFGVDLISYEKLEPWLSLIGKTVWVRKADIGLGLPATVKNLEAVTVTDVKVSNNLVNPVKVTLQASSGTYELGVAITSSNPSWVSGPRPAELYFLLDDPKVIFSWSDKIWSAISETKVFIGMTEEQVYLAWGRPDRVNSTTTRYGTHEQWVYGDDYLYFDNGVLTAIQDY